MGTRRDVREGDTRMLREPSMVRIPRETRVAAVKRCASRPTIQPSPGSTGRRVVLLAACCISAKMACSWFIAGLAIGES